MRAPQHRIRLGVMMWPLVGRDRELGFAGGLLSERATGGVVLAGPAGVGKTRLAIELSQLAAARGSAVEWVRATRSAALIPLGAFAALLPPAAGASTDGAELLARIRQALVERAGGRPLVLCVDDGHLLDHGSAALVHQLAAASEVFALVTVRRGEPVPDALRALWKDELCALLELEELSFAELECLLTEALGGAVDGRSVQTLWALTRGNVLFLRELVLYGVERDALVDDGGIWRWRGELALGMRLAELVGARVEGLPAAASRALEVVAVGAPLELRLLDAGGLAALERLEALEIVQLRSDQRRRYVDLAHPLHGEVVRARLPATRRQAIQDQLADAVEASGGRRRGDVLRVAAWRLEAGGAGNPNLLLRAATRTQGAPIARRLLAEGHRVRAVVRQPDPWHGLLPGCESFAADLMNTDALVHAYAGADVVVVQLPLLFDERAVIQAERVAQALRRSEVRRVVFNTSDPTTAEPIGMPYRDARTLLVGDLEDAPFSISVVEPGVSRRAITTLSTLPATLRGQSP